MLPIISCYSGKTGPEADEPLCQCKVGKFDLGAPTRFSKR